LAQAQECFLQKANLYYIWLIQAFPAVGLALTHLTAGLVWLKLKNAFYRRQLCLYYIWSPILVISSKDSFLWVIIALLSNLQILAVHFLQFGVFSNHFHFCLVSFSSGTVVGLSCSCSVYFVNVIALHREEIFWYCDSVDSWTWVDWVDSFHSI